jgi:hypothetical protein
MKLENRVLAAIKRRSGNVFLRRDITNLGSASQISESLNALIAKQLIQRVGVGIYAKTKIATDKDAGKLQLQGTPDEIALEISQRLGIKPTTSPDKQTQSTDADTFKFDTGSRRINRRIVVDGKQLVFEHRHPQSSSVTSNKVLQIPREGVSQFVKQLAKKFHITYRPTQGDAWAETVTRLAGDEITSDSTNDLLVALKRAHKITDHQMSSLLINHLREKRRVRSI